MTDTTARLTAEQIADRVRARLTGFGGRQGFLSDPGGWLDDMLNDGSEVTEEDHETARRAIAMIVADHEDAPVPDTAAQMVEELRVEWGVVGAYVMDPGPGTVHVPVPDGSMFLSDRDGAQPDGTRGHVIGRRFDDGRDEQILWEDPQARSICGALGKLAELADQAHG